MARRVFLHIGPPKTGTSFLQAAWWQHREELAEQGLLFPGDQRMAHFRAAAVLLEKTRITDRMRPETLRMWDRLTDEVAAWDGDAIISDEHFAPASRSGRQSATAAAKIAMSAGSDVSTAASISRALSIRITATPGGSGIPTGPETSVTAAPARAAAAAMAWPCRPDERLAM